MAALHRSGRVLAMFWNGRNRRIAHETCGPKRSAHHTGTGQCLFAPASPDPQHISTSYVERQKLTIRMSMRRFTRLTNGFSKKAINHSYSVAIHFMHYREPTNHH